MAKVHILNVTVHNNPAPFFTPFQFEIHFECLEELQDDLEFKIIYVGSAETYEFDQTLDQIVVDAVPQGQFKFMFQADPPDTAKIPADDAVGVTVVLITASYREQEFVRVGYYVTNEYEDVEMRENPPVEPQFDKLIRTIAANEPRVTKFKINWDSASAAQNDASAQAAASSSTAANGGEANGEMMMETAAVAANGDSQQQQQQQQQADQPNQIEMSAHNNFENKENISIANQQQQQQQQQQKAFVNPNDLANGGANQINSQQYNETSYDSIMN